MTSFVTMHLLLALLDITNYNYYRKPIIASAHFICEFIHFWKHLWNLIMFLPLQDCTLSSLQIFSNYMAFCGIGLKNAQLYEKSLLENRRNQASLFNLKDCIPESLMKKIYIWKHFFLHESLNFEEQLWPL